MFVRPNGLREKAEAAILGGRPGSAKKRKRHAGSRVVEERDA